MMGGRGPEKTTLSLLKNVTFSLWGVGVKANDTKYDGFFSLKAPLSNVAQTSRSPVVIL